MIRHTDSLPSVSSPVTNLYDLHNVTLPVTTARNDTDDERNERLAVIEVAISGTILFLAVVGNSIVVVSLMLKRGKLSRMHLMMLHLSLADLSVAFFQVLPQMVWDITFRFQGGSFLCGAVKYLQLVTMYASSYVLVSTAVDRYVAICKPFLSQKWTSRHAHLLVLAAWLVSLVFSIPQVFIFSLTEVEETAGVYDCWASFYPPWTLQLYVAWNALSIFMAPSLTLAVLYGHISLAVWKSSKMAENLASRYGAQSNGQRKRQAQTTGQQADHHHHPPLAADPGTRQGKTAWYYSASPSRADGSDQSFTSTSSPLHERIRLNATNPTLSDTRNGGGQTLAKHQQTVVQPSNTYQAQTTVDNVQYDFAELKKSRRYAHGGKSLSDTSHASFSSADVTSSARLLQSGKDPSHVQQGHVTGSTARAGGVGISRAKIKTIKLTLTVVICYLVCWTPYYVAQLWAAYDENVPYDSIFFTLVLLLASVNSCTNPWIYMAFSDTICNTLKAIAVSLSCCLRWGSCRHPSDGRGRYSLSHGAGCRATSASLSSSSTRASHVVNGVSRL